MLQFPAKVMLEITELLSLHNPSNDGYPGGISACHRLALTHGALIRSCRRKQF